MDTNNSSQKLSISYYNRMETLTTYVCSDRNVFRDDCTDQLYKSDLYFVANTNKLLVTVVVISPGHVVFTSVNY